MEEYLYPSTDEITNAFHKLKLEKNLAPCQYSKVCATYLKIGHTTCKIFECPISKWVAVVGLEDRASS